MSTAIDKMYDQNFLVGSVDEKFLAEWQATSTTLAETRYLSELWAKSKTPWFMENVTISWPSDIMNLRYVAAQLESRRGALREAKYSLLNKQLEVDEAKAALEREVQDTLTSDHQARRYLILIAQKEEEIEETLVKFRGAMEEVATYKQLHDELVARLGVLTQERINEMDHRAQLLRALIQSVRSVRQSSRIDAGNQEYLEQCGCNPDWAFQQIVQYLSSQTGAAFSTQALNEFINKLADEVISV
jgi:hypothetical protein